MLLGLSSVPAFSCPSPQNTLKLSSLYNRPSFFSNCSFSIVYTIFFKRVDFPLPRIPMIELRSLFKRTSCSIPFASLYVTRSIITLPGFSSPGFLSWILILFFGSQRICFSPSNVGSALIQVDNVPISSSLCASEQQTTGFCNAS